MITHLKIMNGITSGRLRFVPDPSRKYGTVAQIGDYTFYFDQTDDADLNPEEYVKRVPILEIVNRIFEELRLMALDCSTEDEYNYYDEILSASSEP